ncbi:uncharacterized protein [Parasteatoda tepidariorum]|uniref:uncharacterized protein n=1 Tax=Parasteatoda tepidariorum TaxID=114398 RepID=UPI001C7276BA|nr:uncharacterized protein LOC122270637 [Parasteatoda tepidariorum]
MKIFAGLILCIGIGVVSCDQLCYLNRVFKCRWNLNYGAGWCQSSLDLARCQIQAAEECNTGFADVARKVLFHLTEACDESSTLKIDLTGSCGLGMFEEHPECLADYNKEFGRPGRYPFDVIDNERILCKHTPSITKCFRNIIENECTLKEYLAFVSVMEPTAELQERVCDTIPIDF